MKERRFCADEPEWMDRPQPLSVELIADLENLRRINAWFGSTQLIEFFCTRWLAPGRTWRILDLATASADLPRWIVRWCRQRNIQVEIEAVDFQPSTLEYARIQCAPYPEITLREGDIRDYVPLERPDIVLCSLALHHFSEPDAVRVLRSMQQTGAARLVVADLARSRRLDLGVWLMTRILFREPMTKDDATTSVERAFSFEEFPKLAQAAGWQAWHHRRFSIGRQALWVEPA